jgi:hypothetical protein
MLIAMSQAHPYVLCLSVHKGIIHCLLDDSEQYAFHLATQPYFRSAKDLKNYLGIGVFSAKTF